MRSSALAEKYAKALFQCAKDAGKESHASQFLTELKVAVNHSDIAAFAKSPLIKPDDKKLAIMAVTKQLNLEEMFANFMVVLAENDRLYLIDEIHQSYQKLLDAEAGITRGVATSAKELTGEEKEEITSVIGKMTSKKVILNFDVNPNLIGSLVAQVGSLTIDDSLKTHLNRLEDDLNRRV